MVSLQELRQRHLDSLEAQKKKSDKGSGGGTSEFAKFELGDNWVRILPGKDEPLEFYAEVHQHKYQDEEGNFKTYQCRKNHNEKCPLCDFYFDLWKRHKALNLPPKEHSKFGTLASKIRAKERVYIRAVVRALEAKGEDPVKYFVATDRLFKKIMGAVINPDLCDDDDPDNTTILSIDRGNDFNILMTKQGEFNSFDESSPKLKKTKLHSDPQKARAYLEHPLDVRTQVKLEDYDEGKKIVAYLESTLNTVRTESASKSTTEDPPFSPDDDGEAKFNQEIKG